MFVGNALSPAKVVSVTVIDLALKAARVVVPDYQLSLAIGKRPERAAGGQAHRVADRYPLRRGPRRRKRVMARIDDSCEREANNTADSRPILDRPSA